MKIYSTPQIQRSPKFGISLDCDDESDGGQSKVRDPIMSWQERSKPNYNASLTQQQEVKQLQNKVDDLSRAVSEMKTLLTKALNIKGKKVR